MKKSIESKRQIETVHDTPPAVRNEQRPTTLAPLIVLTTDAIDIYPKSVNEGLIDQSIALDEAGTENKQTSRIQTKKGANGVDYEYEYIYYYYDDDEKAASGGAGGDGKKVAAAAATTQPTNKSRYTNLDRSGGTSTTTTVAAPLEPKTAGRGRAAAPISAGDDGPSAVAEERLPINTRFPPRTNGAVATSDVDVATKKQPNSVKRPSLELVDSHSFNRDEKVNKNSRTFENEFDRSATEAKEAVKRPAATTAAVTSVPAAVAVSVAAAEIADNSAAANDETTPADTTTPLMDKVAFDLYAILANANTDRMLTDDNDEVEMTVANLLASDASTMAAGDMETVDDDDADARTTGTTPTTAAATTTLAITTTTTATTTTTTTTTEPTTLPAPVSQSDSRKLPFGSGRNRFRFRGGQSSTETPPEVTSELVHHKSNRFSRPLSG